MKLNPLVKELQTIILYVYENMRIVTNIHRYLSMFIDLNLAKLNRVLFYTQSCRLLKPILECSYRRTPRPIIIQDHGKDCPLENITHCIYHKIRFFKIRWICDKRSLDSNLNICIKISAKSGISFSQNTHENYYLATAFTNIS